MKPGNHQETARRAAARLVKCALCVVALGTSPGSLAEAETATYTYDELNRLTSATVAGSRIEYTYDAAGNLTRILTPFSIAVSVGGGGMGTVVDDRGKIDCGADCSGSYDQNALVTLSASSAPGSRFADWSGVCAGTGDCIVEVDGHEAVAAIFEVIESDLGATLADSPDPVDANALLTLLVDIVNLGPDPASNVNVSLTLPRDAVFLSVSGAGWTCSETLGTVSCSLPDLAVGPAEPITAEVLQPTEGLITSTVIVDADGIDANVANDSDGESTTVEAPLTADLSISVTDLGHIAVPTAPLEYTVTVENYGPDPSAGALVTDSFPPELGSVLWSCAPSSGAACAPAGAGDISDIVDLPVGARLVYHVVGVVGTSASGSMKNQAMVLGGVGSSDPALADNSHVLVTPVDPAGCSELIVSDQSVFTEVTEEGCRIRAGENLTIYAGGHLIMRARTRILLVDGLVVTEHGRLTAVTDPSTLP